MREKLAPLNGMRCRFRGTFERYDTFTKGGFPVERALFTHVCGVDRPGEELTDHVWIVRGEQINRLCLSAGDVVEFTATVEPYWKGYADEQTRDYRLSRQTKFSVVTPLVPVFELKVPSAQLDLFG